MPAKSPYNFVPAPEWKDVYKPDWAGDVSHDLPFSDGESGEIEIEIVAETPIFIKSGKEPRDKTQYFPSYIKDGKKTHYIPGSSIKGMLRNVLEIMSRSMLNPELVSDDRFSFRDINDRSYYKDQFKIKNVRAGWLTINDQNNWIIESSEFCQIRHVDIDTKFGTNYKIMFLKDNNNREKKFPNDYRFSFNKYWDLYDIDNQETGIRFNIEIENKHNYSRKLAKPTEYGEFEGNIVFTGQPGWRDESTKKGKVHEFVFYENSSKKKHRYYIPIDVKENFKYSYSDKNKDDNDWNLFFREQFYEGLKVPVFYQELNGVVIHFGLAYLYKLPYKHSIHNIQPLKEYLQHSNRDTSGVMDMAKTIFGHASKDEGLKGRVAVSHAICTNEVIYPNEVSIVLGQPKASYYPHYLSNRTEKSAYDDPNARLAGFKRYFNRKSSVTQNLGEANNENDNIRTKFKPLNSGSVFKAYIRFHNLRKCELGALLSAITFHGNQQYVRHQLGGAKPYGFGKVSVNIKDISEITTQNTAEGFMECFERLMIENVAYPNKNWFTSDAICALFAMGSGKVNGIQDLTYPTLREHQRKESKLAYPNYNKDSIERFYREE